MTEEELVAIESQIPMAMDNGNLSDRQSRIMKVLIDTVRFEKRKTEKHAETVSKLAAILQTVLNNDPEVVEILKPELLKLVEQVKDRIK